MDNPKGEMPFLDHLEELRWRIIWSLASIVIGSAVGIWGVMKLNVIDVLKAPYYRGVAAVAIDHPEFVTNLGNGELVSSSLQGPFFFKMKLGIVAGLLLASPIVVYQIWGFFAPALEKRERRVIVPSMTLGLFLFAAGVAFAYFVALPISIRFMLLVGAEDFHFMLNAGEYLSFVSGLLLTFGLVFELPVVVTILSYLGLVTPAFLRSKRRHAIVGMLVLACALSPGDAVIMTLMLMIPLLVLYELGIVLSTMVRRERIDTTPLILPMLLMWEARRALQRRHSGRSHAVAGGWA